MSIITLCKPYTISGGADPQSHTINIDINSDSANTSNIDAYYTVNGGAVTGLQSFSASGVVTGQNYTETATGLNTGDIVRICVDVTISTIEGDTGVVDFAGSITQLADDGCEITHSIDAACAWSAIGEMVEPDCSAAPASINCDDMPVTFNIPNATAIQSISPPLIDYTANINASGDITITTNVAGQGLGGTHTFIVLGEGATCEFDLNIVPCTVSGPALSSQDCPVFPTAQADQPNTQQAEYLGNNLFCPFTGSGTLTLSGSIPSSWFVVVGNCYRFEIPPNTGATGILAYSVTIDDGVNPPVTCSGNTLEVIGL